MISPLSAILADAKKNRYAVGCFNAIDLEMARGIIRAAEDLRSPVILAHAEVHLKYSTLEEIAPILVNMASMAKVPVAILYDHGKDFACTVKAMQLGFNAVMYGSVISGSHMPNLMYMTTFEDMPSREEHWKTFGNDPEWKKLSAMEKYQNNVSKIDIVFMHPTDYSGI
jgi:fructose/tagatose bisphosphate aldolase